MATSPARSPSLELGGPASPWLPDGDTSSPEGSAAQVVNTVDSGGAAHRDSALWRPTESMSAASSRSPNWGRTDTTPRTRAESATQSTVFFGEASSLGWAKEDAPQKGRDLKATENSLRLSFLEPPKESRGVSTSLLAVAEKKAERIKYLENLGAFTLPSDAACEEILLAYFKWFHPCFPIIDRPSFATAFGNKTASPLLLQSMLFVGATYCEHSVLRSLGFTDRSVARSSFYGHAKDIYDADHETDKLIITQALFLMSFWRAGPQLEKDTRHWLAAAVTLAQTQGIHRSMYCLCTTFGWTC